MNNFLDRAKELLPEYELLRQRIHSFGGVGFDVRESAELIIAELKSLNIPCREIAPCTIEGLIGDGEKAILLRADFDALPMTEEDPPPYAAKNGTFHACGHDFHAAMLLLAARMLKEREAELNGTVKLLFQPAEEICKGAKAAIEGGILSSPGVSMAFGMHLSAGETNSGVGKVLCTRGAAYAAAQTVIINVTGKGGHGSAPENAIDPNMLLCHILVAIEHMLASEKQPDQSLVLTFGVIAGGTSANAIPDTAQARGTMRTFDAETMRFAKQRIAEIANGIACAMRGNVEVLYPDNCPDIPLINDAAAVDTIEPYLSEAAGQENVTMMDKPYWMGGEDFCYIAASVPSVMIMLGAGSVDEGYPFGAHSSRVRFAPEVVPVGAALHANVAYRYINED